MKALAVCSLIAFAGVAAPQVPLGPSQKVKSSMSANMAVVEYEQAPVRKVIREILAVKGLQISIDAKVDGAVTLYLRKVSRETALQQVLRQVDATYRLRGDRVEIMRKGDDLAPGAAALNAKLADTKPLQPNHLISYVDRPIREVLSALFDCAGVSYTVAPDVNGNVTAIIGDKSFEKNLQEITRQVDATYRIEGGVIQVLPRIGEFIGGSGGDQGSSKAFPFPSP